MREKGDLLDADGSVEGLRRTPSTQFDRTTMLTPDPAQAGRFDVALDVGWSSRRGVFGGYQCAIAVRGAETLVAGREARTLITSFLRPAQVGPAVLTVQEIRRSRSL